MNAMIGSDLVPDYMTAVHEGGFMGGPTAIMATMWMRGSSRRDPICWRRRLRQIMPSARIPPLLVWPSMKGRPCRSGIRGGRLSGSTVHESQSAERV